MFTSLEATLGVPSFSLMDPATPEKRGVFSPHMNAIVLLCSVNTGDFSKFTGARSVKFQYVVCSTLDY